MTYRILLSILIGLLGPVQSIAQTRTQQAYSVNPKDTDPAINTFTDKPLQNHIAYINPAVKARNQLFVFLPGTDGFPAVYDRIDSLAANLGYHSIGLMYPNDPSVGSLCGVSTDANCFENVRREIIDGTDRSPLVNVNRANSIENRLLKLLQYLNGQHPADGWNQFYDGTNQIVWRKIVVSGHSQGGGHAGVIAKYQAVARVVFFASPKDYSILLRKPAAWISPTHATPTEAYFSFVHAEDDNGCTPQQQLDIYNALGMNLFGTVVNTDGRASPYATAHILTTTLSTTNAHGCVVVDNAVPLAAATPAYLPVWTYMLTQPVSATTTTPPPIITGVTEEPVPGLQCRVYPNPGNGAFLIELTTDQPVAYTLRVVDLTGQVLIDKAGQTDTGLNQLTVVPSTSAGMLLLVMKVGDTVLTRRLIRE